MKLIMKLCFFSAQPSFTLSTLLSSQCHLPCQNASFQKSHVQVLTPVPQNMTFQRPLRKVIQVKLDSRVDPLQRHSGMFRKHEEGTKEGHRKRQSISQRKRPREASPVSTLPVNIRLPLLSDSICSLHNPLSLWCFVIQPRHTNTPWLLSSLAVLPSPDSSQLFLDI